MKTTRTVLILLATTIVPAPLAAQQAVADPPLGAIGSAPSAGVVLSPGDVIRITVWRKPELSGEFVIAADSSVTHPLYREVRVAGVPLETSEARLRAFLQGLEGEPRFVMEPLLRVTVGGEVVRPNLYTLRPQTSISQAIALAGGPTERGRRDRVRVLRGATELRLALTGAGGGGAQTPIHSGDEIVIERRRNVFRDFVAPTLTLAGATAAILNVILRYR